VFRHGRARSLLAAGALIAAAACSESPTSPSPASSSPASSSAEAADPNAAASAQDTFPVAGIGATRFVAFGDSITEGIESSFDTAIADFVLTAATPVSYPTQLGNFLNTRFPGQAGQFAVLNHGVGGERASTGAQRLPGVLSSARPQVLLLLEGINDLGAGGAGVSATVDHLRTMVETAQLFNATVLIGNMFQTYRTEQELPDGTTKIRENARQLIPAFNDAIRQMAQGRQNVFIVDINSAFGLNRSLVGGDGLHPTPEGYARIAQAFADALALAFPVRGAFQ
jgi:lysophospholipase L1-like esterase